MNYKENVLICASLFLSLPQRVQVRYLHRLRNPVLRLRLKVLIRLYKQKSNIKYILTTVVAARVVTVIFRLNITARRHTSSSLQIEVRVVHWCQHRCLLLLQNPQVLLSQHSLLLLWCELLWLLLPLLLLLRHSSVLQMLSTL